MIFVIWSFSGILLPGFGVHLVLIIECHDQAIKYIKEIRPALHSWNKKATENSWSFSILKT
jgi:L-cystine uptake protein TcyP (sodium:dicarboxylate symporter family)